MQESSDNGSLEIPPPIELDSRPAAANPGDSSSPTPGPGVSAPPKASPPQSDSPKLRCSYCGTPYALEGARHRPFCSQRCQELDLRNWLTESYGLPIEGDASPEDLVGDSSDSE